MHADEASTRFPFISLEKALIRAHQIFQGDKSGKPMAVSTAFELWSYSGKSSGGFQTISALKNYGLIEDEGANADRRIKLTEQARNYFLDERDETRAEMLRKFALSPSLFFVLWHHDKWSEGLPADTVARSHLKLVRKMNDQSSRALLSVLKENIKFTGIDTHTTQSVESPDPSRDQAPPTEMERKANMQNDQGAAPPPLELIKLAQIGQNKPIMFDMETVSVSARFDCAEDLADFIEKLKKLQPLMPTRH